MLLAAVNVIQMVASPLHGKYLPSDIFLPPIAIFALAKKDGLKTVFFCFVGLSYKATTSYAGGDKNL